MGNDWVGVVEAGYELGATDDEWLRGVAGAAQPLLDEGLGMIAYCFRPTGAPGQYDVGPFLSLADPAHTGFFQQFIFASSAEFRRRAFSLPCSTISHLTRDLPEDRATLVATSERMGAQDAVGISAIDPTGAGCILSALLPRMSRIPRTKAAAWGRVAAHLAAGYRLRRVGAGIGADAFAGAEAVVDEKARVQHATGPAEPRVAREALREAAAGLMRAVGPLRRRDPGEALAAWRALVAGRWSLIDHFDRDGRRFLIARRNDPEGRVPDRLTLREWQVAGFACLGHSNKLIAYELGLAPTTIATLLRRAAAKLGVRSRAELIHRFSELATERPPSGDGSDA